MKKAKKSLPLTFLATLLSLGSLNPFAHAETKSELKTKILSALMRAPAFTQAGIQVVRDPAHDEGMAPGWAQYQARKRKDNWQIAAIAASGVGTAFLAFGGVAFGLFEGAKRVADSHLQLGYITFFVKLPSPKAYAELFCEYSVEKKTRKTEVYLCRTSAYTNNLLSPYTNVTIHSWPKNFNFHNDYRNTSRSGQDFIRINDGSDQGTSIVLKIVL